MAAATIIEPSLAETARRIAELVLEADSLLEKLESDSDLFHALGGAHIDTAAYAARAYIGAGA
jgi:hypothetical protein